MPHHFNTLIDFNIVKASASMDVKLCKIQKTINFTYFAPKIFHINPFKTVYIYTFATLTVHIYTITIVVYTIILLISHFTPFFFSFSSLCKRNSISNFSSPHLLFPHIHTNTSTETNQHKNTQTHPHTNTSTQKYINTLMRTNQ